MVTIPNVPFGNYKAIEFMIGVDSARNNSELKRETLDPANGCFGVGAVDTLWQN